MNFFSKLMLSATIFVALPVAAADKERLVTSAKDVVGCYERINFSPALMSQMNPVEPWKSPYQWFCFEPNGKFMWTGSSEYRQYTARELRNTLNKMPSPFHYQYIGNNTIRIGDDAGREVYDWISYFYTENRTAPDGTKTDKGTLVMAVFDADKGQAVYWRYLKKLK